MKKLLLLFLLAFLGNFIKAQELPKRITVGVHAGLSAPLNVEYAFDSYALPGISFGLNADYNFKNNISIGLEVYATAHDIDSQMLADDLLFTQSRHFDVNVLSTDVVAGSFEHYLLMATAKYNFNLGSKFILDAGLGLGLNAFITPAYSTAVFFDDPIALNLQQLTDVGDSFGYAFAAKGDLGIRYNVTPRLGIRLGAQYFSSTNLWYTATVTTSELDDLLIYDISQEELEFEYPASWLNFSLGLTYSFGDRSE
jgi:hypothetical protein